MREHLTRFKPMNKLTDTRRAAIIRALVEGNSVRSTARLTGAAKATVLKLLVELGEFCSIYQYHALCDLPTRRVEMDEIWAYSGAKQKNATKPGQGDLWTFTAIDADSKLIFSWLVGQRVQESAQRFVRDVASRLTRLTNAFSKKAENHAHAVSLYFMFYNYCRPHMTLTKARGGVKTTPAMASGLTDHVWTVEEILDLMNPAKLLQWK